MATVLWLLIAVSSPGLRAAGTASRPAGRADEAPEFAALLDTYCVSCHNSRTRVAGLALDRTDRFDFAKYAEVWEKAAEKLRAGVMPPRGRPRPAAADAARLASWAEGELDRLAQTRPNPGRAATFHRLNRAEYQNAVRDVFGLAIDAAALLPPDDANFGFDNVGNLLSISPALFDRYVMAARKVSWLALGAPPPSPGVETFLVPDGVHQDDVVTQLSDDLPFGSRGGTAVRHYFASSGEYVFTVRLKRDKYDTIEGLGEASQLEIRVDGALIKRFTVGGDMRGAGPTGFTAHMLGSEAFEQYAAEADANLTVRVPIAAGSRVVGVAFVGKWTAAEGALLPTSGEFADGDDDFFNHPSVASVSIAGPYSAVTAIDVEPRRRVLSCSPGGGPASESCARRILSSLVKRAYRGNGTAADIDGLLHIYREGVRDGDFESGIRLAIQRLLVDPKFLFRMEFDPAASRPGVPYRIDDVALASRLSFFLWSSVPDDELLSLAARRALHRPDVLVAQVRRMLKDRRARALVENFAGQWLELRNLATVAPDPGLFQAFDENLRRAMLEETQLFLADQIREDRSVVDLLKADYSFLNERLAKHYGIPDVSGPAFRRVTLSDERRRGLLGHASILTLTSPPNRTSPVFRGKWILENVLGTPPPPPPKNVPGLPDKPAPGTSTTVRERLEQHRSNPVCAACHAPMDPLGFALESYDAIGRWRTSDEGKPVDTTGTLPTGATFAGVQGLREALLAQPENIARTVATKLMAYAIGRAIEAHDRPAIRTVVRSSAPAGFRWSTLIIEVVKSAPFQMRMPATSSPNPQRASRGAESGRALQ